MENATKALLIAAAVLIAIILIAFGMKIFNSTSETTKVATSTGETITSQTGIATSTAVDSMQGATSYLIGKESTPIEKVATYLNSNVTGNNKTKEQVKTAIDNIKEQNIDGKFEGIRVCVSYYDKENQRGSMFGESYDGFLKCLESMELNSFDVYTKTEEDYIIVYFSY